ncbi:MAG: hypothetical protein JST04_10120 [Bdellovibrionales bacterium]|nr:hypothetical protein [Bdellovibrionales bacterium]
MRIPSFAGFAVVMLSLGAQPAFAKGGCEALVDRVLASQGIGPAARTLAAPDRAGAAFTLVEDQHRQLVYRREFFGSLYKDPALSNYLAALHFPAKPDPKTEAAAVAAYRAKAGAWARSKKSSGVTVSADGTSASIVDYLKMNELGGEVVERNALAAHPEFAWFDPEPPVGTNEMRAYQRPPLPAAAERRVILFARDGKATRISIQGARSGGKGGISTSFRIDANCGVAELRTDPMDLGPSAAGMRLTAKTCAPVLALPESAKAPETRKAAEPFLAKIAAEDPDFREAIGNGQDSTYVAVTKKYYEAKRALCRAWIAPKSKSAPDTAGSGHSSPAVKHGEDAV